jgi:hypothetical protein
MNEVHAGRKPAPPPGDQRIPPARLLQMLADRFGAFEANASSSIIVR